MYCLLILNDSWVGAKPERGQWRGFAVAVILTEYFYTPVKYPLTLKGYIIG